MGLWFVTVCLFANELHDWKFHFCAGRDSDSTDEQRIYGTPFPINMAVLLTVMVYGLVLASLILVKSKQLRGSFENR